MCTNFQSRNVVITTREDDVTGYELKTFKLEYDAENSGPKLIMNSLPSCNNIYEQKQSRLPTV